MNVKSLANPKERVRWKACCGVFAVLTLITVLLPWGYYRLSANQRVIGVIEISTIPPGRLKDSAAIGVVSWNIAHGRGNTDTNLSGNDNDKRQRVEQIADLLAEIDADVVVLNEVDFDATWSGGVNQAEAIAKAAGYRWCVTQANLDFGFLFRRWYFGNAILSRLPVDNARIVPLTPLRRWEALVVGHKRGLMCNINLQQDQQKKIALMALHLESRGESIRVQQVGDVVSSAAETNFPLIVAGDLNTTPSGAPQSAKDARGVNAFDQLVAAVGGSYLPRQFDQPQTFTFPARNPTKIIDWILTSDPLFKLSDYHVVPTELSDHRPVVTAIRF